MVGFHRAGHIYMYMYKGHISDQLSVAWDRDYSNVLGWLKAHLGFAVIKATVPMFQYLRRSCVTCRSGAGIDDEAVLLDA